MSAGRHVFEYAAVRVMPRAERGEFINAGVVLYCQGLDFLGCAVHLDEARLLALDPAVDVAGVRSGLVAFETVCDGKPEPAPCAPPAGQRFRWLTAPRSTIVQPGPVHAGLTADPPAELAHLLDVLVR
jgi:hypothetical protein